MDNTKALVRPRSSEEARIANPDTIERVYVGTPLGAPTREGILHNYRRACYATRLLIDEGYAPVAPHLLYCILLEEQIPEHRQLGINLDMALMPGFQKVILFTPDGTPNTLSSGMKLDLSRATELDRRRMEVFARIDDELAQAVLTLASRGLPIEYRKLPEVPEGWSPSFLTPGGYWLQPVEASVGV